MSSRSGQLTEKWKDLLDHPDMPAIKDSHRRYVVSQLLENTETTARDAMSAGQRSPLSLLVEDAPANQTSGISNYDPVLISLIRRAAPRLIAYDVCGVQPMTGPTGLIFALRARYGAQNGTEALYNEANTEYGTVVAGSSNTTLGQSQIGPNTSVPVSGNSATYNFAGGMSTTQGEALGSTGNVAFPEMSFSIEKVTVTVKERALKGEVSIENIQDMKAIHGLDALNEMGTILSNELLAEINREVVRTIYVSASPGAQENVITAGTFDLDTDSNGRWLVEKFKGLNFQIQREANAIAKGTRRGKGNILICSSDVASALNSAGMLVYNPSYNTDLQVDDAGITFAGLLNGQIKVYIDPYSVGQYFVAGYKGVNPWDAGLFYAPYTPLQYLNAVSPNTFHPSIAFKTRYGMVANPFSRGATASDGSIVQNVNVYYRRVLVNNLQ